MQYRQFGSLDWYVSALGFGAMRLPVLKGEASRIDEELATRMLRHAIDHGVNYVDTAYPYHGGNSESFIGRALQDGYRGRVRLATKFPSWMAKEEADFDRIFDEQRERLQCETIDFYLLHSLNENFWRHLKELKVLDWAERALADGRIKHLGFSFHDQYQAFQEIVDAYDNWTLCQIQYNYMDEDYQAGTRGLRYAADRGLAVVVMEPIRGGFLARRPPDPIQKLWDSAAQRWTPAEWALRWVWNHPKVSVVLSGMSTMEHVEQNLSTADQARQESLTDEELTTIAQVAETFRGMGSVPCTNCKYCLPCPSGVNIPRIFEIYNEAVMFQAVMQSPHVVARVLYGWLDESERADACTECGTCEELCPQSIEIRHWLAKAHELLG